MSHLEERIKHTFLLWEDAKEELLKKAEIGQDVEKIKEFFDRYGQLESEIIQLVHEEIAKLDKLVRVHNEKQEISMETARAEEELSAIMI